MSKQTYINGFCKTASAAGVDPQALARYAMSYGTEKQAQESKPRFQTNGWAPRGVSTKDIPLLLIDSDGAFEYRGYKDFDDLYRAMGPNGWDELAFNDEYSKPARKRHELLGIANPEYKEWLGAHTNAINSVISKYAPTYNDANYDHKWNPRWLSKAMVRDYNKAMFDATNTPVKVESPKK